MKDYIRNDTEGLFKGEEISPIEACDSALLDGQHRIRCITEADLENCDYKEFD